MTGTVLKYMKDGIIKVFYANGNMSYVRKTGMWTNLNNKGKRWQKNIKDNSEEPLNPIIVEHRVDLETMSNPPIWKHPTTLLLLLGDVYIREDKTTIIVYQDGSRLVKFFDGTSIFTSA